MRTATPEAVKLLISACSISDIKTKAYLDLGFHSGLRPAELCQLRWSDIDIEARTVLVRNGKGGRRRVSEIAQGYGWIEAHMANQKGEYVFSTRTGRPWATSQIRRKLGRLASKTGVKISPHSLRHGHAAAVWEATRDLAAVSQQLGHGWLSTTDLYLRDISAIRGSIGGIGF